MSKQSSTQRGRNGRGHSSRRGGRQRYQPRRPVKDDSARLPPATGRKRESEEYLGLVERYKAPLLDIPLPGTGGGYHVGYLLDKHGMTYSVGDRAVEKAQLTANAFTALFDETGMEPKDALQLIINPLNKFIHGNREEIEQRSGQPIDRTLIYIRPMLYAAAIRSRRNLDDNDFWAMFFRTDPRTRKKVVGEQYRDDECLVLRALDVNEVKQFPTDWARRCVIWGKPSVEMAGVKVEHLSPNWQGDHFQLYPDEKQTFTRKIYLENGTTDYVDEEWTAVQCAWWVRFFNLVRKLSTASYRAYTQKGANRYMSVKMLHRDLKHARTYFTDLKGDQRDLFERACAIGELARKYGYIPPYIGNFFINCGGDNSDAVIWREITKIVDLGILSVPALWECGLDEHVQRNHMIEMNTLPPVDIIMKYPEEAFQVCGLIDEHIPEWTSVLRETVQIALQSRKDIGFSMAEEAAKLAAKDREDLESVHSVEDVLSVEDEDRFKWIVECIERSGANRDVDALVNYIQKHFRQ